VISCFVFFMMPSACKDSDKMSVAELETPFKACISAVEKKARNLEKRKVTILYVNGILRYDKKKIPYSWYYTSWISFSGMEYFIVLLLSCTV